jgi:hypothetical protein
MKELFRRQNLPPVLAKFLLLRHQVSDGYCRRALVDESGIIRAYLGTYNSSENGRSAWDALHGTTQ